MAKKNIPYDQKYYDPEIECASREDIEALQLERLNEELAFAYENSPYYKRTWDAAGLEPHCETLADLQKFPFINKQTERDCQGVGSFFGELCAVPEDDVVYMATSSGSTGVPTMSPFNQKDFDDFMDAESRLFWQVGMRPNDRYLHGMNFALYVGGPCVIGAQNLGALGIWVGAVPSSRLLWAMKHYQPTHMWSSPSYAWLLSQKAIEQGYDPKKDFPNLRTIIISGEPGGSIESTRHAIEEVWGAEVYDFFGLSDIYGACAGMCEEKDGLHLIEDQILVETVDPVTGEVLPDGEKGEIVYTTLLKHARPMIRFRSGDIGWVDKTPCHCGRTTSRIHILGRKDEMFIVSAVNVFPSDIEAVVRKDKGLTGVYNVPATAENYTTKYEVSVERAAHSEEPFDEISKRVEGSLKAHCGVRPAKVLVFDTDKLGASSEHKAKRFIDERTSTQAAVAVEKQFEEKDNK